MAIISTRRARLTAGIAAVVVAVGIGVAVDRAGDHGPSQAAVDYPVTIYTHTLPDGKVVVGTATRRTRTIPESSPEWRPPPATDPTAP
jgi:hypothetical protein